GTDRRAEITRERPADERQVLLQIGTIQAEIGARVGVVFLARVHRQNHVQRVAGGAGENENNNRQNRQSNQRLQKAKQHKADHRLLNVGGARLLHIGGGAPPPPPPPPHPPFP